MRSYSGALGAQCYERGRKDQLAMENAETPAIASRRMGVTSLFSERS